MEAQFILCRTLAFLVLLGLCIGILEKNMETTMEGLGFRI